MVHTRVQTLRSWLWFLLCYPGCQCGSGAVSRKVWHKVLLASSEPEGLSGPVLLGSSTSSDRETHPQGNCSLPPAVSGPGLCPALTHVGP